MTARASDTRLTDALDLDETGKAEGKIVAVAPDGATYELVDAAAAGDFQPLDSDLTAIAALTTTAFGRALLALANQAALLSAAGAAAASHQHAGEDVTSGTIADARIASTLARDSEVTAAINALSTVYQPLDADLTAVAALTTTAFGRGLLTLANQAALLAAAGAAAASHAHAGEEITSGTIADARIAASIARDSEVTAAVSAEATARDAAISAAIAALIDSSPGALDTLNELAAALGDDPNFATTITTALAGKQPLDSDLTSIAALSTTAFGRSLLTLADAAALLAEAGAAAAAHSHSGADITSGTVAEARIHADIARDSEVAASIAALSSVYQPLDADLTSIAALSTTAYGRSLLEAANAAALRTLAGVVIGTDVPSKAAFDADVADLAAHIADTVDAHDASAISSVPAGTLAATTVQAALDELDSEKTTLAAAQTEIADQRRVASILVSDPNGDAITTGDGKAYYRIPSVLNGHNLVAVAASLSTASSSGVPTIQVRNATQTADMLSTRITIDANETDSATAAAAAVIDATNDDVATGDQLYIDIDVAGTGAKGLIVELHFEAP